MIGAGSWGTALTARLSANGHRVTIWSVSQREVDLLNTEHEQKEKLPGVILPDSMLATTDLKTAVRDKDLLVMAVPSMFTRSTAAQLKEALREVCPEGKLPPIVSAAKGLEENTLMTLTQIIEDEIPGIRTVVLFGPTHAEEVGIGLPTAIVAGSTRREDALLVQDIFMSPEFRVYTSPDPLGMQIGAALKNVIALAAGVADGLGYGDNTKAALITRGIAEITRLGEAMGGRSETFAGLTGIGDLIVTCASMHSRNRRAGILIGQGRTPEEAMKEVNQVVEGVFCAKAARQLSEKLQTEAPIVEQVCRVLFEGASAAEAVRELMQRDKKFENPSALWPE